LLKITEDKIALFLEAHQLPATYADDAVSFLFPVAKAIYQQQKTKPLIVGLQGSQGSGKSTSADFLKLLLHHEFELNVAVCSIDDFYLRATDDPKPKSEWLSIEPRIDVLIFEGWCVGLTHQANSELSNAVNELEENDDPKGDWRAFVNTQLSQEYANIFKQLDMLIALQAPSFECVFEWRQLQEHKLIEKLKAQGKSTELTLSPNEVKRFIQHYQRLTEHGLRSLKEHADFILELNTEHRMTSLVSKEVKES